jgi:hypothetical protein
VFEALSVKLSRRRDSSSSATFASSREQVRAEAVVDPLPERDVLAQTPADRESNASGSANTLVVAVRDEKTITIASRGIATPPELDVTRDDRHIPCVGVDSRSVSRPHAIDADGSSFTICHCRGFSASRRIISVQHLRRRLVACDEQLLDDAQHLRHVERALVDDLRVVVIDARVQQVREQVVSRLVRRVDLLGEVRLELVARPRSAAIR